MKERRGGGAKKKGRSENRRSNLFLYLLSLDLPHPSLSYVMFLSICSALQQGRRINRTKGEWPEGPTRPK
jgi:hypothetical protein